MSIRISIITIVFNDLVGFRKTFKSVNNQSYKNFEFIVIDGKSTDGTFEFISEQSKYISNWVSEQDEGIYDAMNKGLELVSGDYVIFLNAGDCFYSYETLSKSIGYIQIPDTVYFGRASIIGDKQDWLFPPLNYNNNNINTWLEYNVPNHQAMFFPKSYYSKNKYNLSLKISSDKDYKLNAQKNNQLPFVFCDFILCEFSLGGVSSSNDWKNSINISKELWVIDSKYYSFWFAINNQVKHYLKLILNILLGKRMFHEILNCIKYKHFKKE